MGAQPFTEPFRKYFLGIPLGLWVQMNLAAGIPDPSRGYSPVASQNRIMPFH